MIFIHAAAVRTPHGHTVDAAFNAWQAKAPAAQPLTRFDASTYPKSHGAEIKDAPVIKREHRHLRRMGAFALAAGLEALGDRKPAPERFGLFAAYGGLRAHWEDLMPAMQRQQGDQETPWLNGLKDLHPFWMLKHLSNNTHALLAEAIDARGDGATYGGSNAGAQAIEGASNALLLRAIDIALIVAYDSLLEPETLITIGDRTPGEAAVALLLSREPTAIALEAWSGTEASIAARARSPVSIEHTFGDTGGATSVLQAILISEALRSGALEGPQQALCRGGGLIEVRAGGV